MSVERFRYCVENHKLLSYDDPHADECPDPLTNVLAGPEIRYVAPAGRTNRA